MLRMISLSPVMIKETARRSINMDKVGTVLQSEMPLSFAKKKKKKSEKVHECGRNGLKQAENQ